MRKKRKFTQEGRSSFSPSKTNRSINEDIQTEERPSTEKNKSTFSKAKQRIITWNEIEFKPPAKNINLHRINGELQVKRTPTDFTEQPDANQYFSTTLNRKKSTDLDFELA